MLRSGRHRQCCCELLCTARTNAHYFYLCCALGQLGADDVGSPHSAGFVMLGRMKMLTKGACMLLAVGVHERKLNTEY